VGFAVGRRCRQTLCERCARWRLGEPAQDAVPGGRERMESERDLPVDRRGVWFIGIVEQRQVGPEQLHHVERLAGLDRNAEDLRPACEEPLSENWGTRPRKFVMTPALTYAQFREDLMKERWRSKWTEDWNASDR
jgi:hypothetical protein